MIDGEKMRLGEEEYTVPPLNLRMIRKLHESGVLAKVPASRLGLLISVENLDVALEVIHCALLRNYPGLGREQLEDVVDMGNVEPLIRAALNAPGLVPTQGEAKAGQ